MSSDVTELGKVPNHVVKTCYDAKSHEFVGNMPDVSRDIGLGTCYAQ